MSTSEGMPYKIEIAAQGLGIPWGLTFLNSEEIIITERVGNVKILNTISGRMTELHGVPLIEEYGQGGLLDVAVAPGYRSGDWIYFTYCKKTDVGMVTVLARAHRIENSIVNWQDMLVTDSATDTGRHFGSRITFDQRGHIFFSVGERGYRPNAQDLSNHAGSILRLNIDGSIPTDNPFAHITGNKPEIWSYGHRNPQGLTYDLTTGRLWSIEHGPRGGDEINLIFPGRNYGWPVISYGKEYWGPVSVGEGVEKDGMEQPVKVYIPSIAPGSLIVYHGDAFPHWQGNLFAGALKLTHINRVTLDIDGNAAGEERLVSELQERIRDLVESPEGWIYFSTDSGNIYRIRPVKI